LKLGLCGAIERVSDTVRDLLEAKEEIIEEFLEFLGLYTTLSSLFTEFMQSLYTKTAKESKDMQSRLVLIDS
jgi:endonuclease III